MLGFQGLEVYRSAIELVGYAARIVPLGEDAIVERLRFTTLTIPIDVAAVGPAAERKQAASAACASAIESAVLLDALKACGVIDDAAHAGGLTLVGRVLLGLKKGEREAGHRRGATM